MTWIAVAIVLLTVGVYLQVGWADFVTFDDPVYVSNNPVILKGLNWETLRYAFSSGPEGNYIPLVWLSHAACVSLFGTWAGGHHLANLFLHVLNSVLLFYFLRRITASAWPSAGVALLFALHPLHVESVAWIAERKDVLSTLFWILTSWAYVRWVERPSKLGYFWMLLLFFLGLLSKSMLVTLPVILLLLDAWPLQRLDLANRGFKALWSREAWKLLVEKLPLFALSAAFGILTILIQKTVGAMSSLSSLPAHQRLSNSLGAIFVYLRQMVWPDKLSAFYPISWDFHPVFHIVGASLGLALITAVCALNLRRRPYLAVGWLWYLVTLLPVVGIIQVGGQSHADRYTYVPLIGVFIALAFLAEEFIYRWRVPRVAVLGVSACFLGGMATLTAAQTQIWRDNLRLFSYALTMDPENPVALLNIGDEYLKLGQLENAQAAYSQGLKYSTSLYLAHYRVGYVLELLGKYDRALVFYRKSYELKPGFLGVNQGLGHLLTRIGKYEEAAPFVERIMHLPDAAGTASDRVNPVTSQVDWALILLSRQQLPEALKATEVALGRDPKSFYAGVVYGRLLYEAGRQDEGNRQLDKVWAMKPADPEQLFNLGMAFLGNHRPEEARHIIERIRTEKPDSPWLSQGLDKLERADPTLTVQTLRSLTPTAKAGSQG
ncbi:tetratricopeptide repeat protein [Geothrix limicola]|uniref:tetratricopeptide repeat protein n=1 Tax=Geothrix limicola TaxID=2927978 RepID=UPI00255229AF|nr:tetratricopeptide repeat protein [Geothrix limicola]